MSLWNYNYVKLLIFPKLEIVFYKLYRIYKIRILLLLFSFSTLLKIVFYKFYGFCRFYRIQLRKILVCRSFTTADEKVHTPNPSNKRKSARMGIMPVVQSATSWSFVKNRGMYFFSKQQLPPSTTEINTEKIYKSFSATKEG